MTRVSVVPVKLTVKLGIPRSKEILCIKKLLSYKGCKDEKNKNKMVGMPSDFFFFFFFFFYCLLQWNFYCLLHRKTVYCSGNRLKSNITPYEKISIIQLTKLKFKIWRVTFLKSFLTTAKLWDRLHFPRNNRFMTCISIWDEEIHVIENWIFSDYQVLFLLLNAPQIENYL